MKKKNEENEGSKGLFYGIDVVHLTVQFPQWGVGKQYCNTV